MNIFFWGKEPPRAIKWGEVRKRILKAIEEEKRVNSPIVSSSSVTSFPDSELSKKVVSSTSNEDSYQLPT